MPSIPHTHKVIIDQGQSVLFFALGGAYKMIQNNPPPPRTLRELVREMHTPYTTHINDNINRISEWAARAVLMNVSVYAAHLRKRQRASQHTRESSTGGRVMKQGKLTRGKTTGVQDEMSSSSVTRLATNATS